MALSRTLPSNVTTTIDDQHTVPFYIAKIGFPTDGMQYLSEAQAVTFETNPYTTAGIRVGAFKHSPDGNQVGTIAILNENDYAADLVLNNKMQDVPISIYLVYSTGPATNTDPVLYVKGVLSGGTITPTQSVFEVVSTSAMSEFVPNEFHTISEGFNWLPPTGLVVQWNGEKYMLEGE